MKQPTSSVQLHSLIAVNLSRYIQRYIWRGYTTPILWTYLSIKNTTPMIKFHTIRTEDRESQTMNAIIKFVFSYKEETTRYALEIFSNPLKSSPSPSPFDEASGVFPFAFFGCFLKPRAHHCTKKKSIDKTCRTDLKWRKKEDDAFHSW